MLTLGSKSSVGSVESVGGVRGLRAKYATPSLTEVDPTVRGFEPWAGGSPSIVPHVGEAFLTGLRASMAARNPSSAAMVLADLPDRWRGFAMEGAGMGFTMRGAIQPWDRAALWRFLSVAGERHTYMIHVGVGWGLARLPRILWPDLRQFDPSVAGLILDGFAFHEVFFKWPEFRRTWTVPFPLGAWPGSEPVGRGHLHQGVGRALWFSCGGSVGLVSRLVNERPREERPSLWAGVGLAAAYAMGRDSAALEQLSGHSGEFRPWLRQGAAFAVEARHRAGTSTSETESCAQVLLDMPVAGVAARVSETRPEPRRSDSGDFDAYDRWRARTAKVLDA